MVRFSSPQEAVGTEHVAPMPRVVPSMSLPPSSTWQRRKRCAGMSEVTCQQQQWQQQRTVNQTCEAPAVHVPATQDGRGACVQHQRHVITRQRSLSCAHHLRCYDRGQSTQVWILEQSGQQQRTQLRVYHTWHLPMMASVQPAALSRCMMSGLQQAVMWLMPHTSADTASSHTQS
jgi:hypothetical protein